MQGASGLSPAPSPLPPPRGGNEAVIGVRLRLAFFVEDEARVIELGLCALSGHRFTVAIGDSKGHESVGIEFNAV